MRKLVFVLLLLLGGCSAGVYSPLVGMELNLSSPLAGDNGRQAVVFPYRADTEGDPMVAAFGPEWRSVEGEYAEYRFNP